MAKKPDQPSFSQLQTEWYARLAKDGFEDIEDTTQPDRPLKKWTCAWKPVEGSYEIEDSIPSNPDESSFPAGKFELEEAFMHKPEFEKVCVDVISHGNQTLKPAQVKLIWINHCDGHSNRAIARGFNIKEQSIRRILAKMYQWMRLV